MHKAGPKGSTIAFTRFKRKHSELSQIYWVHVVGAEAMRKVIQNAPNEQLTIEALQIPIKQQEFALNVKQTKDWLDYYLGRSRLHILAVCAANLESFLKQTAEVFVESQGHKAATGGLSKVGEAIAAPILGRDSLPEPLKYSQSLFEVEFGQHLTNWERAYRLRCELVHNGAVATSRSVKKLGIAGLRLDDQIAYTWVELKRDLHSAYEIAHQIDRKVSGYKFRLTEVEHELRMLKEANSLPPRKEVWPYFHKFGLSSLHKSDRLRLVRSFYGG